MIIENFNPKLNRATVSSVSSFSFGYKIYFTLVLDSNAKKDEILIIKYSIKFMKLLSFYIEDIGTKFNTEDRITYRGVNMKILKNAKQGETFRFISWN